VTRRFALQLDVDNGGTLDKDELWCKVGPERNETPAVDHARNRDRCRGAGGGLTTLTF
jgi:hypothetical protein